MHWRKIFAVCSLGVLLGVWSLSAEADETEVWACCASPGRCSDTTFCCPDDVIGYPPCSEEQPWYCVVECIPIGGGLADPSR